MPAFFLSREALGPFGALITRGEAALIDTGALVDAIARRYSGMRGL